MLSIWLCGKNVLGAAGRAVRSANVTIPFRPTLTGHGVGPGLQPARDCPANPDNLPHSYPAVRPRRKPRTRNVLSQRSREYEIWALRSYQYPVGRLVKLGTGEALTLVSPGFPLGIK